MTSVSALASDSDRLSEPLDDPESQRPIVVGSTAPRTITD